ncbi:unnamed protein product [Closterium sp. Yama58-4]|nr:unnamed protein product [Closterium sp. Yama58-4]
MDKRRLLTEKEDSGLLAELLRRHGPLTFESPQESQIGNEEEESGVLAELVRRQQQVVKAPIIAAVMDPPSPLVEVPQGANESTGQVLLRRQGKLEELAMAPCMYQRRLPANPQEPVLSPSQSHAQVPALERAVAELYQEEQRQRRQQRRQEQVAVGSWIARALSASGTDSMAVAGVNGDNLTTSTERFAASRVKSMVATGFGDNNTIDRYSAASASLVRQQQVAIRSWVAQAELAGLTLPPDLIRESAHAALFAQVQIQMEEQGGMGHSSVHESLEYPHGHAEVEKSSLPFPKQLEKGGCLGASQEEGGMLEGMMMLEALMLQDGGMQEGGMMWGGGTEGAMMQEGGMMQSCCFEASLRSTVHERQGSNSMDPALPGGLTGPASACLNSHDEAPFAASPASRLAAATAAAAACPLPAFFTRNGPGVCCTPACADACCSPAATPGDCHEEEGERGHAVTVQELPATWTPLIGSEKELQWSKARGVADEREVIKAEWAGRKEETGVKEAKRKEVGWEGEDWRPRIRARLDGQAVGLGCIQARSMKERHHRDRIRRGLEKLRRVLPASLTRAQLDTATMVESALSHIRDLQVEIELLENANDPFSRLKYGSKIETPSKICSRGGSMWPSNTVESPKRWPSRSADILYMASQDSPEFVL